MPNIKLFIKKKDSTDSQSVYLRFRPSRSIDVVLASPFKILSEIWDDKNENWDTSQIVKGARTEETKINNAKIEKFNKELSYFKQNVEAFIGNIANKSGDEQKKLIKDFITSEYFGHKVKTEKKYTIPIKFTELIQYYIDYRSVSDKTSGKGAISDNTIKKYNTIKRLISTYDKNLLVTEINDAWRIQFIKYLNKQKYSANTQVKYLKDIRMFCTFAAKEHDVSMQVLTWEIDNRPENISEFITFTFEQLDKIANTKLSSEKLANARDWLLIACYTSVRVSELMTMRSDKIIQHGEDYFIEVYDKKNKRDKIIYLLPQVIEILNKHNGNFPRKISDQKYNEYIKLVGLECGFTHEITSGIMEDGRKIIKKLPFYKFITSHCGRTTYVTLFSGKLPSEIIQLQTNHRSEEMVQRYNKTDEREQMLQQAFSVAEAHKKLGVFHTVLKVV